MRPYRFALLACSAGKLDRPAPARELYTGQLFRLSLQVAEALADTVLVLSAKHGVVTLDQVLAPYDLSLADLQKHQREHWGANVVTDLLRRFGVKDRASRHEGEAVGAGVLCLAPQSYVSALGFWYVRPAQPLKGLGIGQQKAALARMLKEAQPSPSLASLVLDLDQRSPGAADAPVEVDAATWAALVAAARREAA